MPDSSWSRRAMALGCAVVAVVTAGCSERMAGSGSADPQVIIPTQTQAAPAYPAVDGYLLGADEEKVLLRTPEGEERFEVRPADLPTVGIDHLASHVGLLDLGFRVYYEESGGKKYIKGSEEIAPPF